MKRGNEETDHYAYAYLKLLVYCCVALFVCKCMSLSFIVYINETTAVGLLFS